jgi:hypothetical protein
MSTVNRARHWPLSLSAIVGLGLLASMLPSGALARADSDLIYIAPTSGPVGTTITVAGGCGGGGDALALYRASDGMLVDVRVQLGNSPDGPVHPWTTTLQVQRTGVDRFGETHLTTSGAYEVRLFCGMGSSFRSPAHPDATPRALADEIHSFEVTGGLGYTITPASGPLGTVIRVEGSGCVPSGSTWLGEPADALFMFAWLPDGNFSGQDQVPVLTEPDGTFSFTYTVAGLPPHLVLEPGVYPTGLICFGLDEAERSERGWPANDFGYQPFELTGQGDCTIEGTSGDDELHGTDGDDVICGLGGNDTLHGAGGDDVLRGGPGDDDLFGGDGNDSLFGGDGNDALRGSRGDDVLVGGDGTDGAYFIDSPAAISLDLNGGTASGDGDDKLAEIETVRGSPFDDVLLGSEGDDELLGGNGDDLFRGRGGNDLLGGGNGDDRLFGGAGDDLLVGGNDSDQSDGGPGEDTCYSSDGKRVSCELPLGRHDATTPTDPPPSEPTPDDGIVISPDTSDANGMTTARTAAIPPALMTTWYIGNGDYLVMYNTTATQRIGPSIIVGPSGWEAQACSFLKVSILSPVCKANGALNSIDKWQARWFLFNAKRNGGCAVFVFDYGRHGVNQLQSRWKVRSATYYRGSYAPWLIPGRTSNLQVSNPVQARGDHVRAFCS